MLSEEDKHEIMRLLLIEMREHLQKSESREFIEKSAVIGFLDLLDTYA